MIRKNELLMCAGITLFFLTAISIGTVCAVPDPPYGESSDTESEGDWNWHIKAYVWGYWVWAPSVGYYFEETYFKGERAGGFGVWTIGDLRFTYSIDGAETTLYVSGNTVTTQHFYGIYHNLRCKSYSWFGSLLGNWDKETNWATISI